MTTYIDFGPVTYTIYTEEEDGYFYGCWKCSDGETGGSSAACDSEDKALEFAKVNASTNFGYRFKKRGSGNA